MKKVLDIMTALSIFAAPAAYAEFYGSVGLGGVLAGQLTTEGGTRKTDMTVPSYSIAIGYELPTNYKMRAEIEYLNLRSDLKIGHESGTYHVNATMLNALFPIPVSVVTPYVGGGIGVATAALGRDSYDMTTGIDYGFTFQAILGAEFEVPVISAVGLEARYIRTDNEACDSPGDCVNISDDIFALFLKARF